MKNWPAHYEPWPVMLWRLALLVPLLCFLALFAIPLALMMDARDSEQIQG